MKTKGMLEVTEEDLEMLRDALFDVGGIETHLCVSIDKFADFIQRVLECLED